MDQTLIHQFDKIFINLNSKDSDVAKRVLNIFPSEKIEFVEQEPYANQQGHLTASQFSKSKRLLYITEYSGLFFKRCPGANQKKALTCCNYYVLNLGSQCNMNCSYCYLQSYLNSPLMKIYSNIDKALAELENIAKDYGHLPYRVGTGEVIDSLSLDEISLYSRLLIEFFKKYPKWNLEFKTKSNKVDQFLDCEHAGNVVVSWSINAPQIIESEEHGTARLHERIDAAKKCRDKKFPIAFHIDPMIYFPEWKEGYSFLVEQIIKNFTPDEVQVVTVGSLRFQPEQRFMMKERFGMNSYVTRAEVFQSSGGKMRYDSHLRQEMFNFVIDLFRSYDSRWKVYMCMETPETWISSFDKTPMLVPELKDFFRPLPKIN